MIADEPFEQEEPGIAYHAPGTIAEAVALLTEYGDEAKVLAGGQSLLVLLRDGLFAPAALIGLRQIPALSEIAWRADGVLAIGAMTTQKALEQSAIVRERYRALAEAAQVVASPQVRQRGTIAGNICHADPTGDPPAALIALDAAVEVANHDGERQIPVAEFFRDYMEPALEPGDLVTAIVLPAPPDGSAYLKFRVRGVDTALVGVGVGLSLADDGACADVRIGLAGAGATPLRAVAAEAALLGHPITEETMSAAAAAAAGECEPLSDTEASETYRREMAGIFTRRAIARATARARQHQENQRTKR